VGELEERGLEKRGRDRGGYIGVDDEGDGVVSGDEVFAELHAREEVALPVFGHHKNLTGRHVYFGSRLLGRCFGVVLKVASVMMYLKSIQFGK
jgi:hypothetical protein